MYVTGGTRAAPGLGNACPGELYTPLARVYQPPPEPDYSEIRAYSRKVARLFEQEYAHKQTDRAIFVIQIKRKTL
jgi:hypothetical protein